MFGEKGKVSFSFDGDRVQCHVCGRYFRTLLSSHVPRVHGMSAYEYKKEFSLCNTKGILGKRTRQLYYNKMKKLLEEDSRLPYRGASKGGVLYKGETRLQTILLRRGIKLNISKETKINRRKRVSDKVEQFKRMLSLGMTHKQIAFVLGYKDSKSFGNQLYKKTKILNRRID